MISQNGIKKLPVRPTVLLFSLLAVIAVGSFVFLLAQFTLAQFTPPCDTPPNCQPQTGAVTATLMDVLVNGPLAAKEFGKVKDPEGKGYIGIGGGTVLDAGQNVDAGEVRLGIGTSTPGFPLDVISQTSGNPDNDTANIRLGYKGARDVWTGVRLDRGDAQGKGIQSEKWFFGMASSSNNFIIRSDSNTNLVEIPPQKGAACFGGMLVGLSSAAYIANAEGYKAANAKCDSTPGLSGSHVCTTEELFRTQTCKLSKLGESGISGQTAWISNGPSSHPDIAANDCNAWTSNDVAVYGGYWEMNANGGTPQLSTCDYTEGKFACCR